MSVDPASIDESLLHESGHHRGEAERIGARPHLQMKVGELCGFGTTRIEHDHRSQRVVGDLFQHGARMRDAVRLPWVLANEERNLGVFEVATHARAEHATVYKELAGLLLCECTRSIDRAEGPQRCTAVPATEMIALPATAVVQNSRAAVGVANCGKLRSDFADGRVPIDLFERAIVAAAHWQPQTVRAVLIVIEPQRLFARVSARRRMCLIAADAFESAAGVAAESHLDTAIAFAQDARCLLPVTRGLRTVKRLYLGHLFNVYLERWTEESRVICRSNPRAKLRHAETDRAPPSARS